MSTPLTSLVRRILIFWEAGALIHSISITSAIVFRQWQSRGILRQCSIISLDRKRWGMEYIIFWSVSCTGLRHHESNDKFFHTTTPFPSLPNPPFSFPGTKQRLWNKGHTFWMVSFMIAERQLWKVFFGKIPSQVFFKSFHVLIIWMRPSSRQAYTWLFSTLLKDTCDRGPDQESTHSRSKIAQLGGWPKK